MLAHIQDMLTICLGEPPARFSVRLRDKDDKLVLDAMGSNVALLEHALAGDVHAMFFYNSNPGHGYRNPAK